MKSNFEIGDKVFYKGVTISFPGVVTSKGPGSAVIVSDPQWRKVFVKDLSRLKKLEEYYKDLDNNDLINTKWYYRGKEVTLDEYCEIWHEDFKRRMGYKQVEEEKTIVKWYNKGKLE